MNTKTNINNTSSQDTLNANCAMSRRQNISHINIKIMQRLWSVVLAIGSDTVYLDCSQISSSAYLTLAVIAKILDPRTRISRDAERCLDCPQLSSCQ